MNSKDTEDKEIVENIAINFLSECFFKIKDSLSRCGNIVYDVNSKKESESILISFFNHQKRETKEEGEWYYRKFLWRCFKH